LGPLLYKSGDLKKYFGYFVAAARGDSLYSANGASWTVGSRIIGKLYSLAWSNPPGHRVSVVTECGGGVTKGRVYYGTSLGTSWTEVDTSALTTANLFAVESNCSGRFVAMGDSGGVV
jgi:hypothetical protein